MNKTLVLFLLWGFSQIALCHPLTTIIKPRYGINQVGTQDTCGIFFGRRNSVLCNPANLSLNSEEGLVFSLISKTDGDSVEAGQDVLFSPIDKEFLEDLFELNSFNSWEAGSMLEFQTPFFYLSYEPVYAQAAFFIFNPASPEISLTTSKQRKINLTVAEQIKLGSHEYHFGLNTFYYERDYFSGSFSLFELSSSSVDELVDLKASSAINADLGVIYQNKSIRWLPSLSLQYKNFGAKHEVNSERLKDEKALEPILLYETFFKAEFGYDFKMYYGSLAAAVGIYTDKDIATYYSDFTTLSLGYSLWNFEVLGSYSLYTHTAGIKFSSSANSVGIVYGRTKALGDFLDDYEDFAIVNLEIYL
ncbi:MAG: hypothetical protein KC478_01440 [Bacteriovoracaceae bacterium]|nr:hypothetical protein [Bacteriovoracaceae bacterium]